MRRTFIWVSSWLVLGWLGRTMGIGMAQAQGPHGLHAEAMDQGSVRVIVHLRVAPIAAGQSEEAKQQGGTIAQAREALLRELALTSYRVPRVYDTIPFVALEVSPEALRVLEKSVWVVGLEQDVLSAPQ